jgi:tRNA(Ile)-lysidine synthase
MLLDLVKKTIVHFGLLKRGDKVLIACSGGADSVALVEILRELRDAYSLRLGIAHFNHLLRRAAAADEHFVIDLARKLDLPLYLRREDIRAYARKRRLNIEEAGRERRYRFLREAAVRTGAAKIATAHTLNDQAETVLMRILRGSGPAGLGGIAPCIDGLIIRPLIEAERREIEAYLRGRNMPFRQDETNRDLRYLRNRVRRRLIPYIQKNFEPEVVRHLGRLAEICRDEEEVWGRVLQRETDRVILGKRGRCSLDAERLAGLPPALGRRCVRAYLREVKGDLRRLAFRDVEAVRGLAEGKMAVLSGGLSFKRNKGLISIGGKPVPPLRFEHAWDGKETLTIAEIGLSFVGRRIVKRSVGSLGFDDDRRVFLDASKILFPLIVRTRREGDRYRPLGTPGRKKLKEVMRAKGIEAGERRRSPVFLSGGEIVWVPGLPVADAFKVTPSTKRIFMIEKA